jgi:uncharacterized protein YqgQ
MEELKKMLSDNVLDRTQFHKILGILKHLPEIFFWAKTNK